MSVTDFFVSVPKSISCLVDVPLSIKCVAGSIYTRTYMQNSSAFERVPAKWIMEDWGISNDSVTAAIVWLKANGFIELRRTMNGNLVKWVGLPQKDFGDTSPQKPESEIRKNRNAIPQKTESDSAKNGMHSSQIGSHILSHRGEGAHDSVTDSQSATTRTTLPVAPSLCISPKLTGMINAAFPSNPNAVLSKIAIAGWDERRVEAALMKTDPAKGVNYFASICRNMTDAEIDKTLNPPETAKPGTKSTPGRLVSGNGKRVSRDGGKTWEDVATPMPNMPHPSQPPPPQLNWSTGNHQRRTGTPLGGLLGERVVEMTVAEKQSNLGASTVDSGTVAERRAKLESERAAKAELSQRRQKRAMDLIASGKTRIEATAICRAEGLMD